MKYRDWIGGCVIDAENGCGIGYITELYTFGDGRRIQALLMRDEDWHKGLNLVHGEIHYNGNTIFMRRHAWEENEYEYAYKTGIPILQHQDEEILCTVTDYEFDENGQCVSVLSGDQRWDTREMSIGSHAIIRMCNNVKYNSRTISDNDKHDEDEELTIPSSSDPSMLDLAGSELLGRIAIREIRNHIGTVMLEKGGSVDTELLQQAITQGWLVSLAAGTVKKT